MALTALVIQHTMTHAVTGAHAWAQMVRLGASIGGALPALAAAARLPRIDEFNDAVSMVHGRVQKLLANDPV